MMTIINTQAQQSKSDGRQGMERVLARTIVVAMVVVGWWFSGVAVKASEVASEPQPASAISSPASPLAAANPIAGRLAVKVYVTQSGIQSVTGAELEAAGLHLSSAPASLVHLWRGGREIALQLSGVAGDYLQSGSELRFYAPEPGDRWNESDTYWISFGAVPGLRMSSRLPDTADPGAAPVAVQRGAWRDNRVYDSRQAGPGDDYWYAAALTSNAAAVSTTITLNSGLPIAPGAAVVTVAGAVTAGMDHALRVSLGETAGTVTWSGSGNWVVTLTLDVAVASDLLSLQLMPGAAPDGVEIDSVTWQVPVALNFDGRGAIFESVAGQPGHLLQNVPGERALYDVSDPDQPVILSIAPGADVRFYDGPLAHDYVLVDPVHVSLPAVASHTPVDLGSMPYADQVYIVPSFMRASLDPLLALRQTQGINAAAVDVQDIYDTWSHGQVSPEAIRTFLRFARSNWGQPPRYVTLVGDGSSDPRRMLDPRPGNANIIPPYLAPVDGVLGETACDLCYAQLDGDNPLSDLTPDLAIGRLPVATAQALDIVVRKIVDYETAPLNIDGGSWRARVAFVADNYQDASGAIDPAGNFSYVSDLAAATQPEAVDVTRVYYDPYLPTASQQPWREPDALAAYTKVMGVFNSGASLISLYGHGMPTRFAQTAAFANPYDGSATSYLLSQADPARMTNRNRLPIVFEMACLMGAFQTPSLSDTGNTLDENLLLSPNGGAVAVIGSSGMVNLFVYMNLQTGFFQLLNAQAGTPARIGDVIRAGQQALLRYGGVYAVTGFTYILLGDPAMAARLATKDQVGLDHHLYLPAIHLP